MKYSVTLALNRNGARADSVFEADDFRVDAMGSLYITKGSATVACIAGGQWESITVVEPDVYADATKAAAS